MEGRMVKVFHYDGTERTWRSLWRKQPRVVVDFAGYVTGGGINRQLNRPTTATIQAEDALALLQQRTV